MKQIFILSFLIILTLSAASFAHCDHEDGPVVLAAKKALETGNVNLVLVWIKKEHEPEIISKFNKTLIVRKLNSEAAELADRYFYETLVRLHREGEGAPYTGLKPAGLQVDPAVQLSDKSIETNSLKELYGSLNEKLHSNLHDYFDKVISTLNYDPDDVAAGRAFVDAYVRFTHYAEAVNRAAGTLPDIHESAEEHSHNH